MKPGERDAFIAWHDEQVANNYRYDFREEIIKYCRSDVDILRNCCLLYRKIKQSNVAVAWLSYISEKEDLYIEHVRNGGEKWVEPYSLDGYCEETNTAYEFQGCFWHGKDM